MLRGPAEDATVLIEVVDGESGKVGLSVEGVVADVLPDGAVVGIGAGLGGDVDDASGDLTVLGVVMGS